MDSTAGIELGPVSLCPSEEHGGAVVFFPQCLPCLYNFAKFFSMAAKKNDPHVFQVECPCCFANLWVDPQTKEILESEKAKKKKGSLDDLLLKEKKKKEEVDRRFAATAELAKERQKLAKEKFKQALTHIDDDE